MRGGGARAAPARDGLEAELRARRAEIARIEERLLAKEESLEVRGAGADERERSLEDRARNLDTGREQLKPPKRDQVRELERLSGLSAGQAKQLLLRELEDELRHDSARSSARSRRRPAATPTAARAASSPP